MTLNVQVYWAYYQKHVPQSQYFQARRDPQRPLPVLFHRKRKTQRVQLTCPGTVTSQQESQDLNPGLQLFIENCFPSRWAGMTHVRVWSGVA